MPCTSFGAEHSLMTFIGNYLLFNPRQVLSFMGEIKRMFFVLALCLGDLVAVEIC